MRVRTRIRRTSGPVADLDIGVDATVTVGELADLVQRADPTAPTRVSGPTLRCESVTAPAITLDPHLPVGESSLAAPPGGMP